MRQPIRLLWLTLFAVGLGVGALPRPASGHHVVSQYGIAPAEPLTRAKLQLELRQFDFGSEASSGTAVMTTPQIEYAPLPWLSGALRLPVGHVSYESGRTETGIGDLATRLQGRIYATEHGLLMMSAGLGAEFPTGDEAAGLGAGHTELAPYVIVSSSPTDELVFFTSVTQQFSLSSLNGGGHGGHSHDHSYGHVHDHSHGSKGTRSGTSSVHGAIVAPHTDHETRSIVGAAYVFDPVYLATRSNIVLSWTREKTFGPVELTGEVGWRALESLSLALAADVPVAGPDRYRWKTRLAASWQF